MKDSFLFEFSKDGKISSKLSNIIKEFYQSYSQAVCQSGRKKEESDQLFNQLIKLVNHSIQNPPKFGIFHQSVRKPFDYYQFGLDFIKPLIDFEHSKILGRENLDRIHQQVLNGNNVILLANHQTEPDAQILNLMLSEYPSLADRLIYVAGHRVIEDPIAIPMSMGCNLLCIYSKKHMDHPPQDKPKKVSHNQRTMKKMEDLLKEGGKCIYIAPSGGRDRPDEQGQFHVAPFDPQSIEMLWLLAQKAEKPTHFYPLALLTYNLLPPPKKVESELGEKRIAHFTPIFLAFGEELEMNKIASSEKDKKERRNQRANHIFQIVKDYYGRLLLEKNI